MGLLHRMYLPENVGKGWCPFVNTATKDTNMS